jgi:hypothetical protein
VSSAHDHSRVVFDPANLTRMVPPAHDNSRMVFSGALSLYAAERRGSRPAGTAAFAPFGSCAAAPCAGRAWRG